MNGLQLTKISLQNEAATNDAYKNAILSVINDHVVKISVMTEDFYWHYHPNSDEAFLVIEGGLFIDLEDRTITLSTGELFTVPKNVVHRTRPLGNPSVNITFEHADIQTVRVER